MEIVFAADACDNGIGAVISHRFPNGTEKAVAHAGSAHEGRAELWTDRERSTLPGICSKEVPQQHLRIYGRRFKLLTDHKPLLSVFGSKTGVSAHSANRLQRWELVLLAYDFSIEYRRTTHFGQADALSRLIASKKLTEEEDVECKDRRRRYRNST